MAEQIDPLRCRLVLVAPADATVSDFVARFEQAIAGGDVASLILPRHESGEAAQQALAEAVVPLAQQAGIAVLIAADTRIAGRVGADGVHVEGSPRDLADVVDRVGGRLIVGAGGPADRDAALTMGEAQPDYVMFGRLGRDIRPEPHRRNLVLAAWWAQVVEIPCILLGGNDVETLGDAMATGAEFVALSAAVFADGVDPRAAVARANEILAAAPAAGEPAL
jgi:thiamine-phosphate pyrophosphorylase